MAIGMVYFTGVALEELRYRDLAMPRWLAWIGAAAAILSWGRGIGSATGLYSSKS